LGGNVPVRTRYKPIKIAVDVLPNKRLGRRYDMVECVDVMRKRERMRWGEGIVWR
jgi:hypothetical protein